MPVTVYPIHHWMNVGWIVVCLQNLPELRPRKFSRKLF